MKNKGGRPKLSLELSRNLEIKVRCTREEKKIIRDKAAEYGLTVTDFILRKCLDQRVVFNHIDYLKEIHSLNLELGRQGNNINQLAKYANTLSVSNKLNPGVAVKIIETLDVYVNKQEEVRVAFRRLIREMAKTD
ncbi:MAG: MobC family plasmid mobilization relaxosome protein [Prolixibacteraceae bacterium]|nr:MobC family plasmid mobilization relaxosome protein [Prolixibacteraceae bacterium]